MQCPVCGHENSTSARFCENCGSQLADVPKPGPILGDVFETSQESGERRQLTILFSDIVGSTAMSSGLDPEDFHDLIVSYQQIATGAIERYGGQVAQYQGDGIVALFGYPKAHEDDAERAVRAGLKLIIDMNKLNKKVLPVLSDEVKVRVGIHTGLIVVGTEGDTPWFYGDTANFASRVQTAAESNTVVISESTYVLVTGFFLFKDLGFHILKGVPKPMHLYRALRPSGVHGRLHAAGDAPLTPFVGREKERQLLLDHWQKAKIGDGQIVLICGEAGIGKSRLVQQFRNDLSGISHTWVEAGTSSYEKNTPFASTIDLLHNVFEWGPETSPKQQIDDLEQGMSLIGLDIFPAVPLVASLLEIPALDRYPPLLLSPEQQREQLIDTLSRWTLGLARLQPLVLVMEDLHWADPSTLEELSRIASQISDVPILLLFTSRPDNKPVWPASMHLTTVDLKPLDKAQVANMVARLVLTGDVLQLINEKTDGIPLYVEEMAKVIAESGSAMGNIENIPASLQDLLTARLDNLGESREIAQIGAVLGREFSFDLLEKVAGEREISLETALADLVGAGVILVKSQGEDRSYAFRHALLHDSAYRSLLRSKRRKLHLATADIISHDFPEMAEARPEVIAHHLTEAGEFERAVDAWKKAAEHAFSRWALVEAERHYHQGLGALSHLPEAPEKLQTELSLQFSLGQVAQAIHGFGSQESTEAFNRAGDIASQLEDDPTFLLYLLGLFSILNSNSEIVASQEVSDKFLQLALKAKLPMMLTWAYLTQVFQSYMTPDFEKVEYSVQQLLANYNPDEHGWSPFDPKVSGLLHGALGYWHTGYPDKAEERIRYQEETAAGLSPGNQAMAALGACNLYVYLRKPEDVLKYAELMLKLGENQALATFEVWGRIYKGLALTELNCCDESINLLRQGIGDYLAQGTRSSLGWFLGLLATAQAANNQLEDALSTIEDAFGANPEEHVHYPELNRIRGDLFTIQAEQSKRPEDRIRHQSNAEASYREAIRLAETFNCRMPELRATIRLAQLMQKIGRTEEALANLERIFFQFDEGLQTADLQDAATLIDALKNNKESIS